MLQRAVPTGNTFTLQYTLHLKPVSPISPSPFPPFALIRHLALPHPNIHIITTICFPLKLLCQISNTSRHLFPLNITQHTNTPIQNQQQTIASSSMAKSLEDGDCEFEFGCITPTSPSSDPNKADSVSPADQFFLNGRLLPHSFPASSRETTRSNSTSSSMSGTTTTTSSARTSASDASERRAVQKRLATRTLSARERLTTQNGQRQRWQLIAPVPVIGPGVSRRRRSSVDFGRLSPKKKEKIVDDDQGLGFCQRILRSFVKSCKACHAMEGAAVEDDELDRHLQLK